MNHLFTTFKWRTILLCSFCTLWATSCSDDDDESVTPTIAENISSFKEVGQIVIGGGQEGAAEISTYDSKTQRLFVVNNADASIVEAIDFSNPSAMNLLQSIALTSGAVNSVSAYNGLLAVAIENDDKQANGTIEVYDTETLEMVTTINVGALPDMVTFSPDGNYLVVANEGEPNDEYTNDPEGSISIISVNNNYNVVTASFDGFTGQQSSLESQGLRIFGPNASFTQDLEPEYVTISADSRTAWVAIQENNGIAKVDLASGQITDIYPLGFKDYSLAENAIDVSDKDDVVQFNAWANVVGMYQPDAIAYFEVGGTPYVISANEGDARDYDGFSEEERVDDITLDPTAFPNAAELLNETQLGRLKLTNTLGDTDGDGDFDRIYSYGARSFTIWNGDNGSLVYDSQNKLETDLNNNSSLYPDGRSDDKGVEPEGVAVGEVNGKLIAFIGLERADAVVTYDISNPQSPIFLQVLETGDAPEGILFIPATDSPTGGSLLIVSSEDDGLVKVFQPDTL